jgi:hypothetical protein
MVSNLNMNALRRNVGFSKLFALLVVVVVLAFAVAVFSRWKRTRPPIVDYGVPAEVFVVHAERSVMKVRAVSVGAMRDGVYFATDEQMAFFGLKSACKQIKGALTTEWPLARLRSVVEMPEFQNISAERRPSKSATWYVRAHVGPGYKCFGLTEDEAAHKAALQPLLVWAKEVLETHPNEISAHQCASFTTEYLDNFCDVRP